ncbi:MAG TPA: hypothetical protein VGH03_03525 [Caulobacteraceae bacterium]|jgi:hypothetical protein
MSHVRRAGLGAVLVLLAAGAARAAPGPQESDAYTRYDLLAPGSGKFRILYDVTAARPGATAFFNPIRKGSIPTDESVIDRATGAPLKFDVVDGTQAKTDGMPDADPDSDYIEVKLARPVTPDGGGGRIRIEKTYEDARSYYLDGQDLVFERPLGIKRNAVVLPGGYALISCNYPSQVAQEPDGRIRISFLNDTPAEAPLKLRARPAALPTSSVMSARLDERARQTRDIVYFLQPPETHAFQLYHDYTEERPGVGRYVNVVRTGSQVSDPSARNLDTGEDIPARILRGRDITRAGVQDPELGAITPQSEVVVFDFPPLAQGHTLRLRISETYADARSYRLEGSTLIFDRTFGRPANTVVLPAGWRLTGSLAPATISETDDGRTRLDFLNPRGDQLETLVTAERADPPQTTK